jgi:ketosteroid isomerase-like protein
MPARSRRSGKSSTRSRRPSPPPAPGQEAVDLYAINLAKTEYREGYNTGDVTRLLSAFADGFIYMSEGAPTFYGDESRKALAAQARELFRQYQVKVFVIIAFVQFSRDTASDWGWHEFTLTPKAGGPPIKMRKRYVEFWQKEADARWKINFFFDNNDLPPTLLDSYVRAGLKTP